MATPLPTLALVAALLVAPRAQEEPPPVALPESPAARAWAGVGAGTRAVDLVAELGEAHPWLFERDGADSPAAWADWSAWLAAAASAEAVEPRRRAGLALFALRQERWSDAWAHFTALGGHPEWAAALLPCLVPGVPPGTAAGAGGLPAALPSGVELRPAPPPPAADGARFARGPVALRGLAIGDARVDLELLVEAGGIQLVLRTTGGAPAEARVFLPEPEDASLRVTYVDWIRQDDPAQALVAPLDPAAEEVTLYGRWIGRREELPAAPRGALPAALREGGLWLVHEPEADAAERARLAAAARALGALFDVPAGVAVRGEEPEDRAWSGLVARVEPGRQGRRRLARLAAAAELRLLHPAAEDGERSDTGR